jgi:ketosteroid isomerase-like protein
LHILRPDHYQTVIMKYLTLVSLLAFSASGFAQQYNGPKADIDAILKNIEQFSAHLMNGDGEAIGLAYTEEARIMVSGRDIIEGRPAIRDYWTPRGPAKTVYHEIFPVEITITGETAYDFGRYMGTTVKEDGTVVPWKGKYVIIWKKVVGEWKIHVDIWNRTD